MLVCGKIVDLSQDRAHVCMNCTRCGKWSIVFGHDSFFCELLSGENWHTRHTLPEILIDVDNHYMCRKMVIQGAMSSTSMMIPVSAL